RNSHGAAEAPRPAPPRHRTGRTRTTSWIVARAPIRTPRSRRVTAVAHSAIATGSSAPHNDIPLNTFHPIVASLGPSPAPTAEPFWVQLRRTAQVTAHRP